MARHTEVEAVEECTAGTVGHEQLAVGESDVAGELLAASGGVDPYDGGPGERGATQPQEVLRDVVEKDPDVERAGLSQRRGEVGSATALAHHLSPRPGLVVEVQARAWVMLSGLKKVRHRRETPRGWSGAVFGSAGTVPTCPGPHDSERRGIDFPRVGSPVGLTEVAVHHDVPAVIEHRDALDVRDLEGAGHGDPDRGAGRPVGAHLPPRT